MIADLLSIARNGGACSLLFILELPTQRSPLMGITGRLRADPKRAIGELALMKYKLARLAQPSEFGDLPHR